LTQSLAEKAQSFKKHAGLIKAPNAFIRPIGRKSHFFGPMADPGFGEMEQTFP
jgi:hypothetical protein